MSDVQSLAIDACTLNNALNVAQLVILAALLKWVRHDARPRWPSTSSPKPPARFGRDR